MKEYIVYKCKICGSSFILPSEEVKFNEDKGRYLSCPFKVHRDIIVTGAYDSIKECMQHSSYRRERGCIKQIKQVTGRWDYVIWWLEIHVCKTQ